MRTSFDIATQKDIGGRQEQQDQVASFVCARNHQCLLIVADGMGGHSGGAEAAECVMTAARKQWEKHRLNPLPDPYQFLLSIFTEAHTLMAGLQQTQKQNLAPKSTCVVLYIDRQTAYFAHLGDSRLYQFRDNQVLKRTRDHSVVQMLKDLGQIKETEMAKHEDQGRLWKCINDKDKPEPSFSSSDIKPGDYFLLCSDGLWEQLPSQEMLYTLSSSTGMEQAAKELMHRANFRGGDDADNMALGLVHVTTTPRTWRKFVLLPAMALIVATLLAAIVLMWPPENQQNTERFSLFRGLFLSVQRQPDQPSKPCCESQTEVNTQ